MEQMEFDIFVAEGTHYEPEFEGVKRQEERGNKGQEKVFWDEIISGNTRQKVHDKIDRGAMPCVFYLTNVFEKVVDSLYY